MNDICIIEIPVSRKSDFESLVHKFQKKQAKYGMPVGQYIYGVEKRINGYEHISITLINFCAIIKKDDADEYQFCGITKQDKNGVVQNFIENDCFLPYFKEFPTTCNHCNTKRYRNSYYVFEHNEDCVYIGSTCVDDYFGINATAKLQFREKLMQLRTAYQPYDMTISFNEAINFIEKNIAKSWEDIRDDYSEIDKLFNYGGNTTDSTIADLPKIRKVFERCSNNFEQNCFNALEKDYVSVRHWKIYFCAIYKALKLFQKQAISNNTIANKVTSNYQVGERISAPVKVLFVKDYENCFGYRNYTVSRFVKMVNTVTGEILTTYSSGSLSNAKVGEEFMVVGTVKSMNCYNGSESWVLKSCKKN